MATAPLNNESSARWQNLHKEFNAQQFTTEENVAFSNSTLSDKLRSLPSNADFAPLIARDIQSHKDFAPSSSINTWEIVFDEEWQNKDRYNTFSKWCKTAHKGSEYDEVIEKFDIQLEHWMYTLNVVHGSDPCAWFRPPTFPSTLKMSLEMELTSDCSTSYKNRLNARQRRYNINFHINTLYSAFHCNLIDAIYFAKCVNWDAAYDPKHSAKTNIPIYWIFAEITVNFPSTNDIHPSTNTFSVPISCYGLMDVEVNAIKDWYKLSPHCPECRDLRAILQIDDDVEVFVGNKWENGKIIDVVIMDNNEVNNKERNEPIVEYLQVQTINDAIIRYNRYDDRLRPCLNAQSVEYESMILLNRSANESKYDEEELLNPPIDIEKNAPPSYDIGGNGNGKTHIDIPLHNNDPFEAIDPRRVDDEYKAGTHVHDREIHEDIVDINKDLLNSFDPRNGEIMRQYQQDLRETMETMQKLALRRTVATDIFRPVHLVCPKLNYRVLLTDDNEMNMTVIARNDKYDYVELKMIDTDDVELSEMRVYMTKQQLFEHCTTYFHFGDMKQSNNDADFEYEMPKKHKEIKHNIPPKVVRIQKDESLDSIHQYIRTKDSSVSPKRRNVFMQREATQDSKDNNSDEDPRSHLQDSVLCSFLHDDDGGNNMNNKWTTDKFVKAVESNDYKHEDDGVVGDISAQQEFIENNWNPKPDRSGLGTLQTSVDSIGAASINHANTSNLSYNSNQSYNSHQSQESIPEEEPSTPKMISRSPSIDEEDEVDSKQLQAMEDNVDEIEKIEEREDIEGIEEIHDDDDGMVIGSMDTKGIDFAESDDNNDDVDYDAIANNNRSRCSVKRMGTAPNEGKYNENENDRLDFNDIGMNEYDAMDDVLNDLNDNFDFNDVPIERVYTATPSCCNCYFVLCIVLSIILLPMLAPYLPEKYRHFDPNKPQWHWKYYWNNRNYLMDYVQQKISQFVSHYIQ